MHAIFKVVTREGESDVSQVHAAYRMRQGKGSQYHQCQADESSKFHDDPIVVMKVVVQSLWYRLTSELRLPLILKDFHHGHAS